MIISQKLMTSNPCYKQGKSISPTGLMLHSVGCPQPDAQVFIRQWDRSTYTASAVHGIIDGNTGVIYQTLPWTMRGWHCGGKANDTHIGVEMAEPSCITYTSGNAFTVSDLASARAVAERTYTAAVELFAYLCGLYHIRPGSIISHAEGATIGVASGHGDPEHLWRGLGLPYTMDRFRTDVAASLSSATKPALPPDVGADFWAADAIRWTIDTGIMHGFPDGTFRPDEPVTRAQMAAILHRLEDNK